MRRIAGGAVCFVIAALLGWSASRRAGDVDGGVSPAPDDSTQVVHVAERDAFAVRLAEVVNVLPTGTFELERGVLGEFDPADLAWSKLPRTADWLYHVPRNSIEDLCDERWFRNQHLNPADVYIPVDIRAAWLASMAPFQKASGDLFAIEMAAMTPEVDAAIARGWYTTDAAAEVFEKDAPPAVLEAMAKMRAEHGIGGRFRVEAFRNAGSGFVTRYAKGAALRVPVWRLPTVSTARTIQNETFVLAAGRVLAWSSRLGLTPEGTVQRIAARL